MFDFLISLLPEAVQPYRQWLYIGMAISTMVITAIIIHFLLHRLVIRTFGKNASISTKRWKRALFERKLFQYLAFVAQGVVLLLQLNIWLNDTLWFHAPLVTLSRLWILGFSLMGLFALLDALLDVSNGSRLDRHLPLKGFAQTIKLIGVLLGLIIGISLLIGKSPVILMSGLGAMTAVGMLVFKDPILGLVAGIQLSANRMLKKGDWLEMEKYGADGDVIDIGLTTVKVRNWDHTITTIPTYALISDSFRNWRGMTESGGRRIKRSLLVDVTSIRFMQDDEMNTLRHSRYLEPYLNRKDRDLAEFHQKEDLVEQSSILDKRRLTNLGTFRAYLETYLRFHPGIHQGMTLMVRQMPPSEHGQPIEIYAFTNTTAWVQYEGIQSDIFDHIYAVLPEFGLRIHQSPTGHDISRIGQKIQRP